MCRIAVFAQAELVALGAQDRCHHRPWRSWPLLKQSKSGAVTSRGFAGSRTATLLTLLLLGVGGVPGSKSGQKFKQGGVDLARAFLLDPMAGAID